MKRKKFNNVKLVNDHISHKVESWMSAENIDIRSSYSLADIEQLTHLNFVAGIPPFLRGPYSSMYTSRPWTIRQYAGFSTAEESNAYPSSLCSEA